MITATRSIGIDAAHRVTTHGSKCSHLHGHRYTVELTATAEELGQGVETGMVTDFSVLKDVLHEVVYEPADHGLIMWVSDPWIVTFAGGAFAEEIAREPHYGRVPEVGLAGAGAFGKLWITPSVPTAENLASIWLKACRRALLERSNGRVRALRVRVWETPNCVAEAT